MQRINKTVRVKFNVTEQESERLKILAEMYAGGNLSKWLRYAALNCPRKYLTKEDK